MNSCFTISLSLSFFFIKIFSTDFAPKYLYRDCPNATLFTPNSTYQSNLHTLLSSISSAATKSTDGFANSTAGQNPSDWAYGLFLCQGDLDTTSCRDCVATGKQDILQLCPNQRVSIIWYDYCMLRYSNRPIFSAMERTPNFILYNLGNVTNPTLLKQLLEENLNDVAARASHGGSGKKVAAAVMKFTRLQKLYALVQCTLDLTPSDCGSCLQFGIANLVPEKQGGRVSTPSCNVRYEVYPFFNASALPTLVTGAKGKRNKSTVIIIAIAVPIGVVMVLLCLACFSRRNATKTHKAVHGDQSSINVITKAESLQYDLATIQEATDNFCNQNKLGEGGFGEVFKGKLPNGQEIAVKRLSTSSGQGVEEFKNEVVLVEKLHHRNLVQLIGFCIEGEEKILVYEFVQNKSLDYLLFVVIYLLSMQ